MKEKTITIKTNEISQRQYSTLLLELNIIKQQWRSYGVQLNISAPSLKKITITSKDISQKQWAILLLELNLMKKAWKPYGVDINMRASGLKNVLNYGTKLNDGSDTTKRRSV